MTIALRGVVHPKAAVPKPIHRLAEDVCPSNGQQVNYVEMQDVKEHGRSPEDLMNGCWPERSSQESNRREGPMVINKNCKDGGYFSTSRK